ncbi:MAG: VWA domain-containing protein [Bacteroidales bacterium]|jgi:uncharacterized protein YegL|nr:VWA domain-containing protein [Bacteroidales bacterium]
MKTRVFNLIILDESGSMSCIERQALTGVNETLQTIRRAQEKYPEQEQYVTFVPFQTGSIKFVRDCEPISEVKDLEPKDYNPGTCTPLYDAIGLSVNHLKKNVSENDSVLVTIITDGYENDSHEFTSRDISRMVEEMKSKGWLFTYIGANQDAIEVAKTMNIKNALNFVQDEAGTRRMFEKERRSRGRFMDVMHSAFCCYAPSSKEAQELRRNLADSDNFFADDDDKA